MSVSRTIFIQKCAKNRLRLRFLTVWLSSMIQSLRLHMYYIYIYIYWSHPRLTSRLLPCSVPPPRKTTSGTGRKKTSKETDTHESQTHVSFWEKKLGIYWRNICTRVSRACQLLGEEARARVLTVSGDDVLGGDPSPTLVPDYHYPKGGTLTVPQPLPIYTCPECAEPLERVSSRNGREIRRSFLG